MTHDATRDTPAYLRHPTIHGDTLVFVADDDLWSVSAGGGLARRLTAGLSEPSTPCLSPDGTRVAFVGRDEQHPEVYVMPAEGGNARRLTWLGTDTLVRGWTRDGRIVYVTTQGQPFFRNHHGFIVSPDGGAPEPMPWGQVNHWAEGPRGMAVIGRNTADPARWKRYRGGTAGALWIDAEGRGAFRRMSELKGNVTSPMWIGERVYFLGDDEGVGNLYSCRPDGGDPQRHTDHDDFYARHAQTDGTRIVYQHGARIRVFDPASGDDREVAIRTAAHSTQAARKFVPASENLEGFRLHPAGHSIAVSARGQLFGMALWEGAPRRFAQAHDEAQGAGRVRHGHWLADGSTLVAVSDASGEERVVAFAATQSRALPWELGHVTRLRAAPTGTRVAIANQRNEVWIGDVASGELTKIDTSAHARSDDLAWSPDGGWLAYTFATSNRHVAIKLHELASATSTLVTEPEFRDHSPSFDPEGRYLYFISLRTYDPVYDSVQFELSFPRAARPYLIALQAGGRPPFDPDPKGLKDGRDAAGTAPPAPPPSTAPLRVDLDGIARRVAAFPVAENRFERIAGTVGRKVVWTVQPIVGAHGRGGHKDVAGRLEQFEFATGRIETLAEKVDAFELAADGATLAYRSGKRLRVIAADKKPPKSDAGDIDGPPSRKSGWIDLERLRLSIEPRQEWRQMLREVWRLQREGFWSADMSGVDWEAAYARYAPLVERLSTRGELSDLVWELQGELGTSHAYEQGGDHRKPPAIALGYLGCTLRFDAGDGPDGSWEIASLIQGDPWDASADSPLNAIGVEAKVGERIVAVGGQPVSARVPPQALLVHQAGAKVQLTLKSGPGTDATVREVTVTALADEVPAHYRGWVERNRRKVHELSNGRVGYFHLPDMMAAGFAEFHRYFATECDRDALVVDVRYNRGGHVSQLLLEKVARRRLAYTHTRWGTTSTWPDEAAAGPIVTLTNEHAGSDGDIFSHGFKLMKIGPLVGTRTWGGVVGIWPRHTLVDGTTTTQPEYAFWFTDVGWGIENYGTDPDVVVDNAPQDHKAGLDRQLETAVATALQRLAEAKPVAVDGPRPRLARSPLPPRQRG